MYDSFVEDIGSIYDLADVVLITDDRGYIEYYKVFRDVGTRLVPSPEGTHILDLHQHLKESTSTVMKVLERGEPVINEKQTLNLFKERTVEVLTHTFPIKDGDKVIGVIEIDRYMDSDLRRRRSTRRGISSPSSAFYSLEDIVTENKEMKLLMEKVKRAARTSSPVMIWGETGTGKELFAQAVHNHSYRRTNSFLAQNCSAIPLSLGESIFFGTTRGSFTGAEDKIGLFEMANRGTLMLDELNSMDLQLQSKLLRVTESRSVRKIGASEVVNVDVRLISTLNEDPKLVMERGRLRRDLFYRLAVVFIEIPPLRKRRDDILLLANYFVKEYSSLLGIGIKGLDSQVQEAFMSYDWPGNVRELKHVIEAAFNFAEGTEIGLRDIPDYFFTGEKLSQTQGDLKARVDGFERQEIKKALENTTSLKEAAELLAISRQNLRQKMLRHKLEL